MFKERLAEAHDKYMSERERESRVVKALKSLRDEKTREATEDEILARIKATRLLKHALGELGIKAYCHALSQLVECHKVMRVEIDIHIYHTHEIDTKKIAYHVIEHQATSLYNRGRSFN